MAKGIGSSFGSKASPTSDRSFSAKSLPKGKAQPTRQARGGLRKVKGLPVRQGNRALPSIPGMKGASGSAPGGLATGAGGVSGF